MRKTFYGITASVLAVVVCFGTGAETETLDIYGEYPYYTQHYEQGMPALEIPGTEVLDEEADLDGYEPCFILNEAVKGTVDEVADDIQHCTYFDVEQEIFRYMEKAEESDEQFNESEDVKNESRKFMGYSMLQENVGYYQGVPLDLRTTVVGYVACGEENKNELDFWLNDPAGFMSTSYQITFRYDILNHETKEPMTAKGYFGLMDYDYCQGTLFHGNAFRKYYVTQNTNLEMVYTEDGPLYFTRDTMGVALEDQDNWLAVCFEGDSFTITYTMGDIGIGGTTAGDGGFELQERVPDTYITEG
ncbi:MAG: hypothetical protein PHS82_02415 [Lachnospiraceae bacterium]|nr:hypothetical protein [Lachnospiraceae bacterium]